MNLTELYAATPVEKHGDIRVVGERVIVRSDDIYEEYLTLASGELWLARSNRKEIQDLAAIKSKLGI
jgi:hypothetical protein